jgi:hypothetical protein
VRGRASERKSKLEEGSGYSQEDRGLKAGEARIRFGRL